MLRINPFSAERPFRAFFSPEYYSTIILFLDTHYRQRMNEPGKPLCNQTVGTTENWNLLSLYLLIHSYFFFVRCLFSLMQPKRFDTISLQLEHRRYLSKLLSPAILWLLHLIPPHTLIFYKCKSLYFFTDVIVSCSWEMLKKSMCSVGLSDFETLEL